MENLLLRMLFDLSQGLMTPIVIGMSLVSMWLIFLLGQMFRTAADRTIRGSSWRAYVDRVRRNETSTMEWKEHATYQLHRWIADRTATTADLPNLTKEAEVKAHTQLGRLQILVRTGPMLGLVGTLIPLGPALEGLSNGNLQDMGSHMHIAFTMTVFGILIGALSYALYVWQRNWFENDLAELDLLHSLSTFSTLVQTNSAGGKGDESQSTSLAS